MAVIEIAKIQIRRGQENQTGMPQLDSGEFGWAEDTEHLYIGKRIVDGAVDDENTRILTENDLSNFFSLISPGSAVASTSTYRYRDNVPTNSIPGRVYTSIGTKLDDIVSLTDFGVVPSFTATDITLELTAAASSLWANNIIGEDALRQLRLPAGAYFLADTIELPPNTSIVGEGQGLTTLILTNSDVPLFKTVDSQGKFYEDGMANDRSIQPRNIHLEGMTLKYNTATYTAQPLLALDNVNYATIKHVDFGSMTDTTLFVMSIASPATGSGPNTLVINTLEFPEWIDIDPTLGIYFVTGSTGYNQLYAQITGVSIDGDLYTFTTTSTFGDMDFAANESETFSALRFFGWGTGIKVRGQYGTYSSDDLAMTRNIYVTDCNFANLSTCIDASGTTSRLVARNNVFRDSIKGVRLYYASGANIATGPTNAHITENRFEGIAQEGLYVGANPIDVLNGYPKGYPGDHISSYNHYVDVGNGLVINDSYYSTATMYPIVTFDSIGNRTDNDYFSRRKTANNQLRSTPGLGTVPANIYYYYNPLATGYTSIEDKSATSVSIAALTGTNVVSFPITGKDQYIGVKYQLTIPNILSRKGDLVLNVSATGETTVSDMYTYTETQEVYAEDTTDMTARIGSRSIDSTYDKLVVEASLYPTLAGLVGINGGNSTFYITGNADYDGLSAYVLAVVLNGSNYEIYTQSADPQFDYALVGETWTLTKADSPVLAVNVNIPKNYITLYCDSTLSNNAAIIEYQTSIFQ